MKKTDVTNQVNFGNQDDEFLPIEKCICGARFESWEYSLSYYEDDAFECYSCGAKLIFENKITVYKIEAD